MLYPTVDDVSNMGRIIGQNVQVTETDFCLQSGDFVCLILSSQLRF